MTLTTAPPVTPVILVVDDHDAGRFAKANVLRRAGFTVEEAATGQEALARAKTCVPDVVVLDVHLPDVSGLEVCRALKSSAGVPPQVLQVSATAIEDADRVAGLAHGADTYLIEPVAPEILVATTRALLRVRRTEHALFETAGRERAAREEAERANHSKNEFLATLSHELRSPLNAMSGWIWNMRYSPEDRAIRDRALDALDRNLKLQARLIDDLLDISRIEKGKVELTLRPIDLRAVLTDSFEALRARATGQEIDLQMPSDPVPVIGDRQRLTQVVDNLLNNASQFTPVSGRITATLTQAAGTVTLAVTDTGVGIAAEFLPFVFDSFRQAEGGPTRRTGGLGLGLAIVQRLVELHGGTVEATSAGPGHGSTFLIRLATVDQAQIAVAEEASDVDLRHVAILVVEDDPDSRELMQAMLVASGATVTLASNAHEALEALRKERFDMIVSDIAMAKQDGLDLMRAVRAMGIRTPAIAVTAMSTARDRQNTSAAGYARHLPKPIDQATLVRTIAVLLRG